MSSESKLRADRALMASWRRAFAEGDKAVLLDALALCLQANYRVPDWLRDGFLSAFRRVDRGDVRSWDEVFGSAKSRARRGGRWRLANRIAELITTRGPEGVKWDDIGRELGISGGKARQYYYEQFPPEARAAFLQSRRSSKKSR